jgi:hypothetical protein
MIRGLDGDQKISEKTVPQNEQSASKLCNPACLLLWASSLDSPQKIQGLSFPQMTHADPLLKALHNCEDRLHAWIQGSPNNASLFAKNPAEAIRAAGLDLDESLLTELETLMQGIAHKINAA